MDEAVAEFVVRNNPALDLGEVPYTAIGNMDGLGNIIGGVVFNNYTKRDIHLHVAGVTRNWCTRRFIGEVFRYVFLQLGCRRCTGMVAADNEAAIRFDTKLGFQYEGTMRAIMPGDVDCLIFGMLREECRWLTVGELNHGRRNETRARANSTTIPLRQRTRIPPWDLPRSTGL